MFNRRSKLVRGAAIAGAIGVFAAATAVAAFRMRLSVDGGATFPVDITDNGVGDSNGAVGAITWIGSIGGFQINVDTAQSKPVLGSGNQPQLDLSVVATSSTGGGTLLIETTDTGFTGGGGSLVATAGGTQPPNSSVSFDAYTDATNAEYGKTGLHVALGPTSANPFTLAGSKNGNPGSPFSMTNSVAITLRGNGTITGDFNAQVVPEGSSLALVLPGLAPLGLILRRRMKKA